MEGSFWAAGKQLADSNATMHHRIFRVSWLLRLRLPPWQDSSCPPSAVLPKMHATLQSEARYVLH